MLKEGTELSEDFLYIIRRALEAEKVIEQVMSLILKQPALLQRRYIPFAFTHMPLLIHPLNHKNGTGLPGPSHLLIAAGSGEVQFWGQSICPIAPGDF